MAVINGVTVSEIRADFEEGVAEHGPHARRSFLVDSWADRYKVANGLLGYCSNPPGSITSSFSLSVPSSYPDSPNMWARSVAIRGVGRCTDGGQMLQFDHAIVTATYGVPPYNVSQSNSLMSFNPSSPMVYATQEFEFGGEVLTLGAASLQLQGGTPVENDQSIVLPHVNLSLTLHFLPYLPTATIFNAIAKCNSATFLGASAGYVLFRGARSRKTSYTDGTYTQDMNYLFSYRNIARWDASLKPASNPPDWKQLQYKDGTAVIGSTDLNDLIPSFYLSSPAFSQG